MIQQRIRAGLAAAAAGLLLSLSAPAQAAVLQPAEFGRLALWAPVSPAAAAELPAPVEGPQVRRSRRVVLAPAALERLRGWTPASGRPIELDLELFDGRRLGLVPRRIEPAAGRGFVLTAGLTTDPDALFCLAVESGVASGKLSLGDGRSFALRYLPGGGWSLQELAFESGLGCAVGRAPASDPRPHRSLTHPPLTSAPGDEPAAAQAGGSLIDVLVVYTAAAKLASGGVLGMRTRLLAAFAEGNAAFDASGVVHELRLVGMAEVNYNEGPGDLSAHLDALEDDDDGPLDVVHDWRAACGADCVALVTGLAEPDGAGLGGLYLDPPGGWLFSGGPFSVTVESAIEGYTLIHELGHNLGLQHDPDNDNPFVPGSPDYARGHRFTGTDAVQSRTVMAYAPGTRVPRFSNPATSFAGTPTGVPDGGLFGAQEINNAKRLNETGPEIAAFVPLVTKIDPVFVDHSAPGLGDGFSTNPFRTLQLGLLRAKLGAELRLRGPDAPGSQPDLVRDLRIVADQGPVTLGN